MDALAPTFTYCPALTLGAWVVRYTRETVSRIPAQWGRFAAQVPFIPGRVGPASFGLLYGWANDAMEYGCAVEVAPGRALPTGWTQLTIPTSRYAVFRHLGHVSELYALERTILHEWLPASGKARLRGPAGGLELIERYGPRFDARGGQGDIEVWLPVEG
jgi:AraC family transcriptional regulator